MNRSEFYHFALIAAISAAFAFVLIALVVLIWAPEAHQKISNTLGLGLDIFGVIYVAHDIFPFVGVREITRNDMIDEETKEFVAFKQRHVVVGLIAIATGFFCQMFGYWSVEIDTLLGVLN